MADLLISLIWREIQFMHSSMISMHIIMRRAQNGKTLNAVCEVIPTSVILAQLANADGKRIFHPVFNKLPSWIIKSRNVKLLTYVFKTWELIMNIPYNIRSLVKRIHYK